MSGYRSQFNQFACVHVEMRSHEESPTEEGAAARSRPERLTAG